MGVRWRKAFSNSSRRDPETASAAASEKRNSSPRICAKIGSFFSGSGGGGGGGGGGGSNPSTPRLQSVSTTPTFRCRTNPPHPDSPNWRPRTAPPALPSATADGPKRNPSSSRLFQVSSEPSSPRSPSRFSLFKSTLRLSRSSRCGLCAQSVKTSAVGGGGAAVFTAECSHAFHLSCIASSQASKTLVCPVCSATWRHSSPLISSTIPAAQSEATGAVAKMYDDDEPLLVSNSSRGGIFNPIPEADDEDEEDLLQGDYAEEEKEGRFYQHNDDPVGRGIIDVSVMPEAALISSGRRQQNYVVAVKVKAPPPTPLLDPSQRSPIDLVTVLDLRGGGGGKAQTLKRAMRLLISSLGPADRLSIVAYSGAATKRLLPLTRMSRQGQLSARQIVDRLILVSTNPAAPPTPCSGVGDALRKATKVLRDRRDRNPVATVTLLSDHQHFSKSQKIEGTPEIPIHAASSTEAKCVLAGLLSVVLQDVHLHFVIPVGEISAVYSCGSGGAALGGGSVRLGDLQAGEERELLVDLRVPVGPPPPHIMSVKCIYRDGATQELIRCREQGLLLPSLLHHGSSINVQRLRNLFVATRAVADSRRLADLNDLATAVHLLSSARSLLLQSTATISSDKNLVLTLDAEIACLQRRRQQQLQQTASNSPSQRSRWQALVSSTADDGREALTPTSAWRAAERLAKLAIMRKSLNRISDLHGFENARF